jgi:hypothetical protein
MDSDSQSSKRESVAATPLESLVDEHAVARFYGVSVATVRRWCWLRTGPKFHKIGALCRYRMASRQQVGDPASPGNDPLATRYVRADLKRRASRRLMLEEVPVIVLDHVSGIQRPRLPQMWASNQKRLEALQELTWNWYPDLPADQTAIRGSKEELRCK